MAMAHFSRYYSEPIIKRHNPSLLHQRCDSESVALARFSQYPSIDFCNRNCGNDQIRSIFNCLPKVIGIGATDKELNPPRRIDYGRHRSPSRWKVFLRPLRKPLSELAERTGMSSIRPSS